MNSGTSDTPPPPPPDSPKPESDDAKAPEPKAGAKFVLFHNLFQSKLRDFPDVAASAPPPPEAKPRKPKPKPRAKKAEKSIEDIERDAAEDKRQRDQSDHRQLVRLRWVLGLVSLAIVIAWQFSVLCILYHQGNGFLNIPESVLLTLLTTTTVNVFGFLLIVMRFVFPSQKTANGKLRRARRTRRKDK